MTAQNSPPPSQWPQMARDWKRISSPLRPSAQDVESYRQVINIWTQAHPERAPRALILGVTPELYDLPWPERALLRAADRTRAMIDYVWPGPAEAAIHSDWIELDLPDASMDIIVSDGGLIMPDYPRSQQALCNNISRMLAPGGITAFRLYALPAQAESADDVLRALDEGAVPNLSILKLRLGMAMQASPEQGVALADVWKKLRGTLRGKLKGEASGWEELADRLGWSHEYLQVIDAYRDSHASYYFTTAEAAVVLFENAGLSFVKRLTCSYEMGEQCPVVVFQKPA